MNKSRENGPVGRNKTRQSNGTRQKNKRKDSKVESNGSPEIPDRGEISDIPGLPSGGGGAQRERERANTNHTHTHTHARARAPTRKHAHAHTHQGRKSHYRTIQSLLHKIHD